MVGGSCNNEIKGAVEEFTAVVTVTGSANDCNNGDDGSGDNGGNDDNDGDTGGSSGSDGESVVAMGWSHGGTII
jgi:hypothetical protein